MQKLAPLVPRYVRACQEHRWHIETWRKTNRELSEEGDSGLFDAQTGEVLETRRAGYVCHSWRHEGECRKWRASQNFSRLKEALGKVQRKDVMMLVLTLDPWRAPEEETTDKRVLRKLDEIEREFGVHLSPNVHSELNRPWVDAYEGFTRMRRCWQSFAKAFKRTWGRYSYASTVECQRNGWPHLNVILVSKVFAQALGNFQVRTSWKANENGKLTGAGAWLFDHAVSCGFGETVWAERAANKAAVAGYIVKVAGDVDKSAQAFRDSGRTAGEVIKITQLPVAAPMHFRRLRSSPKFLPPPFKREGVTGRLVREPLNAMEGAQREVENRRRRETDSGRPSNDGRSHR